MNKLTALVGAVLLLAMMTGPALASEMAGGEKSVSVTSEMWKQLSPNTFGTGFVPDGVNEEEFRGSIDTFYGVAPSWVGGDEDLTMIEKAEKDLRKHLAPNAFGAGYIPDGVSEEAFRGTIDRHYGVAPAWMGEAEDLTMIEEAEKDLNKHLAPNVIYRRDVN